MDLLSNSKRKSSMDCIYLAMSGYVRVRWTVRFDQARLALLVQAFFNCFYIDGWYGLNQYLKLFIEGQFCIFLNLFSLAVDCVIVCKPKNMTSKVQKDPEFMPLTYATSYGDPDVETDIGKDVFKIT